MRALVLICALLSPSIAGAEPTPLVWPSHRMLAMRISDASVASAIVLDTWHSWRADDRRHAFGCQAVRMGVSVGVNVLAKNLVHRERPDGSNDYSFYSGHTSNAFAASGWRYSVGIPIAIGAGYGRMAADKHFMSDVAAGAVAGLLASRICR